MPARVVFEKAKDDDALADTLRAPNPFPDEEPPTLRSAVPSPEMLASARSHASYTANVRLAIEETLGEKLLRLEREKEALQAAMNKQNEELIGIIVTKDREIEELKKMAFIDQLTGLHTRRLFEEKIQAIANLSLRKARNFSVLFIDLDFFKSINDTLNHEGGDEALREVGRIMRETLRPEDEKYRYGGEELVVIMPDTDKEGAKAAAERLRKAIETQLKPHLIKKYGEKAAKLMCTASIGISSYEASDPESGVQSGDLATKILEQADKAVYQAKERGRNTVAIFGEIPQKAIPEDSMVTAVRETSEGFMDQQVTDLLRRVETIQDSEMREKILLAAARKLRNDRNANG